MSKNASNPITIFFYDDPRIVEKIRTFKDRKRLTVPPFLKIFSKMGLIFFISCSALIASCAHSPSKYTEINLQKNQLSKFDIVALDVSSRELDVKYADSDPSVITPITMAAAGFVGLLPALIALGVEGVKESAASSKNKKLAENIRGNVDRYYFEKLLGDSFCGYLESANLFKINYVHQGSYEILRAKGYHAIITLNIEELSLRREVKTDQLCIYMRVLAKMTDFQHDHVIWEKLEVIKSDEAYTLDECKVEGEKLKSSIDKLINKISFRLASDIIYSK